MPISHDDLVSVLSKAFPTGSVSARDLAGDEDHWEVTVHSAEFVGKNLIQQHRLVQNALKDLNIHAVSIKTVAV
jgi:stress-induced morphogen